MNRASAKESSVIPPRLRNGSGDSGAVSDADSYKLRAIGCRH